MRRGWTWGLGLVLALAAVLAAGCDGPGGGSDADADADADGDVDAGEDGGGDADAAVDADGDEPIGEDWDRDVLFTSLSVDVSASTAEATITLAGSTSSNAASFEAGDLTILSVRSGDRDVPYRVEAGALHVAVPRGAADATVSVAYELHVQADFEGLMGSGVTLTWPYYCGNLFPCHSDPSDGMRFELEVTGLEAGQTAVYAESIPTEAPSYMLAWAVGDYVSTSLGTTAGGTEVVMFHRPDEEAAAAAGGAHLLAAFEWYETTLGPYPFGPRAGALPADWGPGAYGGMEHHPFWHVSAGALSDEAVNVHEAAHGWYGNGVRIACWEDFVLSEGTVSYLEARAIEAVMGEAAAADLWDEYEVRLSRAMLTASMKVAWPDSCGVVDILEDGLFSSIPYMKGAFFFRALEARVGADELLAALALFYREHVGGAATMAELLDTIAAQTGYDPTACAEAWLREEEVPDMAVCPAP